MKKSDQVVIRGINEQVSYSEGGELFGWESIVLHERGERLTELMVAGKLSFDVLCVDACMIEDLIGVQYGFLDLAGLQD